MLLLLAGLIVVVAGQISPNMTLEYIAENINDCSLPRTIWQEHYCNITLQPERYQTVCYPYIKFPKLENGQKLKGIVMFYHGFTACPNHHLQSSAYVTSLGYIAITPLIVGQGIKRGYQCKGTKECVGNGDNPKFIPTSVKPYIDWVDNNNRILKEIKHLTMFHQAPDFQVTAIGLSFGAPLALYSASRDDIVDRVLTVNGHFSTSTGDFDFKIHKCLSSPDAKQCVRNNLDEVDRKTRMMKENLHPDGVVNTDQNGSKLSAILATMREGIRKMRREFKVMLSPIFFDTYGNLVNSITSTLAKLAKRPLIVNGPLFNFPYGWGKKCEANPEKGGYCTFRFKHVFVLEAFAQLSLAQISELKKSLIFGNMNTDVDGFLRDSVTVAMTKKIASTGIKTSRCRYPIGCTSAAYLEDHSEYRCGVPHPCFATYGPGRVFWMDNLHSNLKQFLLNGTVGQRNPKNDMGVCKMANETVGAGEMFDEMGPKYLAQSYRNFRRWD